MKNFILISLFAFSSFTFASEVKLTEAGDQEKLADLVSKLPLSVKTKSVESINSPMSGIVVSSNFPKNDDGPFQFRCESTYFNGSTYASYAKCKIIVDVNHQQFDRNYDQIKIIITDNQLVDALYSTIPYNIPRKKFFSWGRDQATTFEGKSGIVFHYGFICSQSECRLNLSNKNIKE